MPITANRILRIIQAAEVYQLRLDQFITTIQSRDTAIQKGELTKSQAWDQQMLEIELLKTPTAATVVIAEERMRFNLSRKKNEYERKRQERIRRLRGIKQYSKLEEPNMLLGHSTLLSEGGNAAKIKSEVEEQARNEAIAAEKAFHKTPTIDPSQPSSQEEVDMMNEIKRRYAKPEKPVEPIEPNKELGIVPYQPDEYDAEDN